MSDLTAPHFHDEDKARAKLEWIRWPNGPACPHCGGCEKICPMRTNVLGLVIGPHIGKVDVKKGAPLPGAALYPHYM